MTSERRDTVALAIGAHPDDLELGCGGTLATLSASGVRVVMAVVSIPSKLEQRKQEAQCAAKILGCELRFLVPDKTLRVEDLKTYQLVGMIDELVRELSPVAVFTHGRLESHVDHTRVYEASLSSQRIGYFDHFCYSPTTVRPNNIPFFPNTFVDISDKIDIKMKAIQAHFCQFGEREFGFPHVQDADRRGGLLIGVEYAEGFKVERQVLQPGRFLR